MVAVTLFRIVHEAIDNAVGHAAAATIAVRLNVDAGGIGILVSDDGQGRGTLPRHAGAGIANMMTRARLIGAGFRLASGETGRGASVMIDLPRMMAVGVAAQ